MPNKQIPSFNDMGIEHVSVREARERFAPLLTGVATASERVVITRHGKPWVAIVDVDDLSELVKLDEEKFSAFALKHRESVHDVTMEHVPTQAGAANILKDVESNVDAPTEKEQALKSKLIKLEKENKELQFEKAHLEGMVEAFKSMKDADHLPNHIGSKGGVVHGTKVLAGRRNLSISANEAAFVEVAQRLIKMLTVLTRK